VQQVVDTVRQVTGHPVPVQRGPRRSGDPAQLVASSDRIRADLGWTPRHTDLADIVRDAWDVTASTGWHVGSRLEHSISPPHGLSVVRTGRPRTTTARVVKSAAQ
jgi:hypothetical protein